MAKKAINPDRNIKKIPKLPVKIISKSRVPVKPILKPRISNQSDTNKILVENFVALQKVMTKLSDKISKLLDLFEISAKALAEKDFNAGTNTQTEKEIKDKLNSLLDQNKVLARGLTLLHGEEPPPLQTQIPPPQQMQPPMQQRAQQPLQSQIQQQVRQQTPSMTTKPLPQSGQTKPLNPEEYKKSITSKE